MYMHGFFALIKASGVANPPAFVRVGGPAVPCSLYYHSFGQLEPSRLLGRARLPYEAQL